MFEDEYRDMKVREDTVTDIFRMSFACASLSLYIVLKRDLYRTESPVEC